ncbi:MAG: M20/M25/M40 family metallo-hydrolase [Lysobacter sp.]|nr:M20/M25/M40 family metallo-hydrolase [Lysobacter sp.]
MNPKQYVRIPTLLLCAGLATSAWAQNTTRPATGGHARAEADAALAAMRLKQDSNAPVFIVTSRDTYPLMQDLAVDASPSFDSIGTALVVAQTQAQHLGAVSSRIHQKQLRCGGFFAFATRAEAEAFVRSDRAAQIVRKSLLAAYTIDNQATVNPWLPQTSAANILGTISTLSSYQNRYYTSTTGKTSAEWIRTTWQGLAGSRTDVTSELFTACTNCSTQPSVILTIRGNELPGEVVVLGAHLDSINTSGGGSTTQVAPGADDDASGIATLTEVLRVALASGWKPKRTVKFMGYAAEEVGLRGSNAIAQSFRTAGTNVVAVMQLDMTNYKPASGSDMRLVTDYSNADVQAFLTGLFDTYLAPLGMTRGTYTCGYGCSDHASWTSAGYPSGMMFEGGSSSYFSNIHSAGDTLANMGNSAANSAKFAKLGLAFLGEAAKTSTGGGGGNLPPVANFSFATSGLTATFTDTSTDSDGSIASRSWNFGDGTTSTATNSSKTYAAGGTYTVALTVTDNIGASQTKSSAVTVSAGGSTVLTNGVPVTGLSGAANTERRYTMPVPAGATNLRFVTSGGTGDADLYARFGTAPTTTTYDCRSNGGTNAETCVIATAQSGTYHVLVRGYSAFSGLSLTGSYTTGGGGGGTQTYTNGTDVAIADNSTVESPIVVSGRAGNAPTNASVTVAIVHTYQGDLKVDLVAPDGSLYNIHNRTGGSADNLNKTVTLNLSTEALNGTWKLRAQDAATGDTGYINSWSVTF